MFKEHVASVLYGTAADFPMSLWYQLLGQLEHQLNMLHKLKVDPKRTSYQVLYDKHDYNINHFAPLGIKVELHEIPSKRPTWGAHTIKGIIWVIPESIIGAMKCGFQNQEMSG